jgi:hypothetical protein
MINQTVKSEPGPPPPSVSTHGNHRAALPRLPGRLVSATSPSATRRVLRSETLCGDSGMPDGPSTASTTTGRTRRSTCATRSRTVSSCAGTGRVASGR